MAPMPAAEGERCGLRPAAAGFLAADRPTTRGAVYSHTHTTHVFAAQLKGLTEEGNTWLFDWS